MIFVLVPNVENYFLVGFGSHSRLISEELLEIDDHDRLTLEFRDLDLGRYRLNLHRLFVLESDPELVSLDVHRDLLFTSLELECDVFVDQ